jgi:hypothetical protein
VALLLVVTLPWWRALACPFITWDDKIYITQNPLVLAGLGPETFRAAFTATTGAFWLPMTWISLALDARLFGTGPLGFHLTNVMLHIANTLLVYAFWRTATGARARSLAVAALFSMHPLRVESVAWVTERKDVLFAFFGLLALLAYVRYVRAAGRARFGWMAAACLLHLLSLMSKPMLVTLPALLLVLDGWPFGRWPQTSRIREAALLALEKVPLVVISAAVGVTNFAIQQHAGALVQFKNAPLSLRAGNALMSYAYYLRDSFYFEGLSFFYPFQPPTTAGVMLAAVVVAIPVAAAVLLGRRRPREGAPFAVGMAWFFLTLFPTIGLIQSGLQSRADRFTYWPAIGLSVVLVWVWPTEWFRTLRARQLAAAVVAAAVLVLTINTWARLLLWTYPLSLYVDGMQRTENNGVLAFLAGEALENEDRFAEAEALYRKAVADMPQFTDAHLNLGSLLVQRNREDEGWAEIAIARALKPSDPVIDKTERRLREALAQRAATRAATQPK